MTTRRLLRPDDTELTPEQRDAISAISSGPRGTISAPFEAMLAAPELMTRVQLVGEYLRFQSTLPPAVLETAILATARHWDQPFEWGYHYPLAQAAGVSEETLAALGRGERPRDTDSPLSSVWTATQYLLRKEPLDDDLFASLTQEFGQQGVVELIVTVGYYSLLAMVLNTSGAPAPDTGAPALPIETEENPC